MPIGLGGYMTDTHGKRLDEIEVADATRLPLQASLLEARTGTSLAFSPSTGVNVPGMAQRVPAGPRPWVLTFSIAYIITVAGGGALGINCYEIVGQNGTPTLRGASRPERVEAARPAASVGVCEGKAYLAASATPRMLALNLALTRDAGSSLGASIVEYDNDYYRPIIELVQR